MNYAIDLSLKPTTFDLFHVCLAGTVVLLLLISCLLLLSLLICLIRCKKPPVVHPAEPSVKIIEVEKIVHAPAPEPVVLKEFSPDAALQLLGLLQQEARFIDFIKEDISSFSDADIGNAARVVHEGCNKALTEHFTLETVRTEQEGSNITLAEGFDPATVRLTGNIIGTPPFTGTLVHKGWQVTQVRLPKLTLAHNAAILAPAEVEL